MKAFILSILLILTSCNETKEAPKNVEKKSSVQKKERLLFYTADDYPYQDSSGRGPSYKIMMTLKEKLNYDEDQIRFVPWARAFKNVKDRKRNVAIFSMSRKPDRIPHFDWCCYLYEGITNVIITRHKYLENLDGKVVVTWRGDSSEGVADRLVRENQNLYKQVVDSPKDVVETLLKKLADFTVLRKPLILDTCQKEKLDCSSLYYPDREVEARKLIFLAFSTDTDKKLRDEFVKAFKEFRSTAQYQKILEDHGFKFNLPKEFE